jgi:two-component system, probable response regulator PhcQ
VAIANGSSDNEPRSGDGANASRHTVLLVDDDFDILEMFGRVLKREPYQVELAAGAQAALRILDVRPVSVIVSDERMPGMLGTELLARLQAQYPETVRVMLTGQASLEVAQRAINDGQVFRFLTKPIEPRILIRTIREAIAERELRTECSPGLPRARREAAERQTLESQWRGLTHVERDASGAVVLPDVTEDLEAVVREVEAPRAPQTRRGSF